MSDIRLPSEMVVGAVAAVSVAGGIHFWRKTLEALREFTGEFLDRLTPEVEAKARSLLAAGREVGAREVLLKAAGRKDRRMIGTYLRFLPATEPRADRAAKAAAPPEAGTGMRANRRKNLVVSFIIAGFVLLMVGMVVSGVQDSAPVVIGCGALAILLLAVLLDRRLKRRQPLTKLSARERQAIKRAEAGSGPAVAAEIAVLVKERRKIEAIKRLREATGADLRTSKATIDHFERTGRMPPPFDELLS